MKCLCQLEFHWPKWPSCARMNCLNPTVLRPTYKATVLFAIWIAILKSTIHTVVFHNKEEVLCSTMIENDYLMTLHNLDNIFKTLWMASYAQYEEQNVENDSSHLEYSLIWSAISCIIKIKRQSGTPLVNSNSALTALISRFTALSVKSGPMKNWANMSRASINFSLFTLKK